MLSLRGKPIVVTGAAQGIGRTCAEGLAARGAHVLVNDLNREGVEAVARAITAQGGVAVAHVADISDWDAAAGLVESCVAAFGSIAGLVNNAGIFTMAMVEDLTEPDLRKLAEVNVFGAIACCRHAVRQMTAQGFGSIVNTVSGAQAGVSGMSAYGATKGAVASFTYALALELGSGPVRVNAISPRAVTQQRTIRNEFRASRGLMDVVPSEQGAQQQSPSNNLPVYEFLLSDASAGVNGQVIRIDGLELSLFSHPTALAPVLRQPRWTAELVASAFDETLRQHQAALGV